MGAGAEMRAAGSSLAALGALMALIAAGDAAAQSARQTAEMTARGCVIRSEAGQRYWACPPGALTSTGSIAPQVRPEPVRRAAATSKAKNYCVRLCDGYFFPLEGFSGKGDEARQAACEAICPSAETALYSTRPGEEIDKARTLRDARRYGELPVAFLYRQRLVEGCTCRRRDEVSLLEAARNDATLRPGDIIVTESGMEVYQGDSRFVDYREAPSIGRSTREILTRLEVSSR
jgi:hypothetical protein